MQEAGRRGYSSSSPSYTSRRAEGETEVEDGDADDASVDGSVATELAEDVEEEAVVEGAAGEGDVPGKKK